MPEPLQNQWSNFQQQLPILRNLAIPRCFHTSSTTTNMELHGFSDASLLAMAAVVYLKVTDQSGKVTITLIQAKTKVVPLKRLTIPRLELSFNSPIFLFSSQQTPPLRLLGCLHTHHAGRILYIIECPIFKKPHQKLFGVLFLERKIPLIVRPEGSSQNELYNMRYDGRVQNGSLNLLRNGVK